MSVRFDKWPLKVYILVFTYAEKYEGSGTECYIEGVFSSKQLAEGYKQKLIEDEISRNLSENRSLDYEESKRMRNRQLQIAEFEIV